MIQTKIEAVGLEEVVKQLGGSEPKARSVIMRSINRVASQVKTSMAREAKATYIVKTKAVRAATNSTKAKKMNLVAIVTAKGNPMPLGDFKVSPRRAVAIGKSGKRTPGIYKGKVKTSSGLKGVDRMFFAKGFAMVRPENATRAENKNIKNWLALGPSVPKMIENKKIIDRITKLTQEQLQKRIKIELDHEFGKGG